MSYRPVCRLSDLGESQPRRVEVDGEAVVLVRQGSEVFALDDVCSHAEVSLAEGDVVDGAIECWLHGSRFDLATGEPSGPPAFEPVATYPTAVRTDDDGTETVAVSVLGSTEPASQIRN